MENSETIVGKTFGRLTVLEKSSTKKHGTTYLYKCICSCNNNIVYRTKHSLTSGRSQSCGCLRKEKLKKQGLAKGKHHVGEQIGNWILQEKTDKRIDNKIVWKCKCSKCGFEREIASFCLRPDTTPFCHCEKDTFHNSKGEKRIIDILIDNEINFSCEYTFDNLQSNGKYLRFDFYLPSYNVLIEYDGKQHFEYTNSGWNTKENFDELCFRDKMKNKYCLSNNIPLIRIPYTHLQDLCLEDLLPETTEFLVEEVENDKEYLKTC